MARQSQIKHPSQEDLLRALTAGQTGVDTSIAVQGAIRGEDLASTVLKNKQGQEDRIRTLAEKIKQAKNQKDLVGQISKENPLAGLAAAVDPTQASKQQLEQYFTEKQAKAPKQPTYTKIGETDDEIILADLADPTKQFRVKAPGVGKKGGKDIAGKEKLTLDIEKERAKVIIGKTKQALGLVGPFTTGVGSLLGNLPATPAKDLKGTVDTIKANLGFEQLAKMRAASPTGGALGQIAVKELEFLQAAVSNLNTDQSEDQVRSNLEEVLLRYENWLKAVEQSESAPGNPGTPLPAGNPGGSGLSPEQRRARIAELKAKAAQGTIGR